MSEKEKKYDEIEQYLRGELGGDELAAFEERLRSDAAFQKEIALHKNLQAFLADADNQKLRAALAFENKQRFKGRVVAWDKKVLAVAASVIILLFTGYFLWRSGSSSTPQELFAKNFAPYQMVLASRSNDPLAETSNAAINAYQQKSFEEAIPLWSALIEKDSLHVAALFYRGISFLAIKRSEEARKDLILISKRTNNPFAQQASWYTGLSYLQSNDKTQACSFFQSLKDQSYKQKEIQTILDRICN